MTFWPWFVPRTEPPVQLREVGRDRGHLLTQSCSDVHLRVCHFRTGDEECCCSMGSSRQTMIALIFALSSDDRSIAGVVAAAGRCCSSSRERWWSTTPNGGHRIGPLVVWVVGVCISWAGNNKSAESRRKTQTKNI